MSNLNGGEVMPVGDYQSRLNGTGAWSIDKKFTFDPKTGYYKPNSEWDYSAIILNEDAIKYNGKILAGTHDGVSDEYASEAAMVAFASHEERHTRQKLFEFYTKKRGANGLYIDQQNSKGENGIEYKTRMHEIEAFSVQWDVLKEYFNKPK